MSLSNSGIEKKVRVEICDQLIDGRYLNAVDSNFLESVLQDVQNFYDKCIQASILVFPPFNNYRRFLIHKLVEDNFDNLSTFSIGHSSGRRTVVCWKEQLLSKESITEPCVTITDAMGVQKQTNSNEVQDPKVSISCSERKKVRAIPDVAIYRPPALRKSDEGPSPSNVNERKPRASKQRRPDIAVYVPRALRGIQKPAASPKSISPASGFILKPLSVSSSKSGRNIEDNVVPSQNGKTNVNKKIDDVCIKTISQRSDTTPVSNPGIKESSQSLHSPALDSSLDGQVMLDSSRVNLSLSSTTSSIEVSSHVEPDVVNEDITDINASPKVLAEKSKEVPKPSAEGEYDRFTVKSEESISSEDIKVSGAKMDRMNSEKVTEEFAADEQCLIVKQNCSEVDNNRVIRKSLRSPSSSEEGEMVLLESSSCKIEESRNVEVNVSQNTEVFVQSKRKKSDGIIKGVGDSQERNFNVDCVRSNNLDRFQKLEAAGTCESNSEDDSLPLSSWEELFELPVEGTEVSKAGESKTQKLIEEVVSAVGKVNVVEKPRCNYSQYRTDNANFLSELSHVVEIYGFPSEFKTQDLISVLSSFGGGNSGAPAFEIKWVDDTHALAVFASSFVAADVLNLNHPLVKTRSLDESSAASKAKAKKTCESLRVPFRPRPETCPALAQRLITGALGVNRRQSKAEREEERRLLREAREKRRNAAKERDAAWEGTIASTL